MHRCAKRRLDVDSGCEAIDPKERFDREQRLGVHDADGAPITSASAAMARVDIAAREELFVWRRAYLARYLRLSIADVERAPVWLLDRYCAALADLLKAEAPTGSIEGRAEQDFT